MADFSPFELSFEKVIYGPPGKPSRMIWLLGKRQEALTALKDSISRAVHEGGIPYLEEQRPLTPHITLCRMYEQEWRRFEPKPDINEQFPATFTIDAVVVMESQLQRGGAEYSVLETITLREK